MRRVVMLASVITTVALGASGCRVVLHDAELSLSGAGAAIDRVEYSTPGHTAVEHPRSLPWSISTSVDSGDISVTAKVTRGTAHCAITVEGKQVASQQAPAGSALVCRYSVPK